MTPDRYAKDYILDETTDENGQVSFQYNYHGPVYKLTADQRLNRQVRLLTCLSWLLFVTAMLPKSHAMHVWYVSLPFAFAAIPLWLMARIALFLRRSGGKDADVPAAGTSPDGKGLLRDDLSGMRNRRDQ